MTRYLYPDKPFLTFNEVEGKIRISGRGTRKLVNAGLDLAAAMREASAAVGGMGEDMMWHLAPLFPEELP